MNCRTVKSLIESAYASGMPLLPPIEGGPAWIDSDHYRYTINVKAEGTGSGAASGAATKVPILRALLEDRFQLKTHRETREVSGYALTVAKGGPKLKPFQEGSCVDIGVVKPLTKTPPPAHEPGERPVLCGVNRARKGNGPNVTWDIPGTSLDFLARTFLGIAFGDRPVFNRTGIDGLFDIHLEFTPDESTPGPGGFRPAAPVESGTAAPAGPSIFTALQQQLGLKLEAARGPREVLVIDRVEKPSEN